MPISLEEIRPARVTFTLPSSNLQLTFRPFSLEDELWMQREYGDGIQKLFEQCRFQDIFRIAFRQIENKEELKKRTVKIVNEEGDEVDIEMGGLKLLNALCHGFEEKMLVLTSLLECIGISRPMQEKLAKEAGAEATAEKKSLIGPKSSTPSAPSTDGPPTTSSV